MEFVDVCKQYFQAFQEKDIEIIERMVHQSVELRDWELMVSGKDNFIDANKKIFDDVENISIIIKNQGIQSKSTSESVIVFNEIEIHLNNNSIILEVIDVIEFEVKMQTIVATTLQTYKESKISITLFRPLKTLSLRTRKLYHT